MHEKKRKQFEELLKRIRNGNEADAGQAVQESDTTKAEQDCKSRYH